MIRHDDKTLINALEAAVRAVARIEADGEAALADELDVVATVYEALVKAIKRGDARCERTGRKVAAGARRGLRRRHERMRETPYLPESDKLLLHRISG